MEAIYNENLKADSFQVSGLENLKGNDLAERFSEGVGEKITYYTQPAKEFGEILKPFVGEAGAAGVASFYEGLQNSTDFPPKFNPNMFEILEKLPVQMTSLAKWAKDHKGYFLN